MNPHEFKALGESSGGAGGWFVSPQLSPAYVIDLARNKSCVLLAGGWTLPMTTEEMTLVKILTDPTAYLGCRACKNNGERRNVRTDQIEGHGGRVSGSSVAGHFLRMHRIAAT